MNIKDLTLEELKVCALLYENIGSILRPLEIILYTDLDIDIAKHLNIPVNKVKEIQFKQHNTILKGQWHEKEYYTAPQIVIQSLTDKKLLLEQEEDDQKFYTLNRSEDLKEFFKELEVQIALGSIHYDFEWVPFSYNRTTLDLYEEEHDERLKDM